MAHSYLFLKNNVWEKAVEDKLLIFEVNGCLRYLVLPKHCISRENQILAYFELMIQQGSFEAQYFSQITS